MVRAVALRNARSLGGLGENAFALRPVDIRRVHFRAHGDHAHRLQQLAGHEHTYERRLLRVGKHSHDNVVDVVDRIASGGRQPAVWRNADADAVYAICGFNSARARSGCSGVILQIYRPKAGMMSGMA